MPTIDQYKTLITIVEKGSFRAASESLHKAQSAVSYNIKSLEEELDHLKVTCTRRIPVDTRVFIVPKSKLELEEITP